MQNSTLQRYLSIKENCHFSAQCLGNHLNKTVYVEFCVLFTFQLLIPMRKTFKLSSHFVYDWIPSYRNNQGAPIKQKVHSTGEYISMVHKGAFCSGISAHDSYLYEDQFLVSNNTNKGLHQLLSFELKVFWALYIEYRRGGFMLPVFMFELCLQTNLVYLQLLFCFDVFNYLITFNSDVNLQI